MINVSNLKKSYSNFDLDCSLEVRKGNITGLIGQNGAGKSTIFKSILGLIRPDSGDIKIFNLNIKDISEKDKQKIGVVFSDSSFSEYFTINDISIILNNLYEDYKKEWFDKKCNEYQLDKKLKIKELSTGMKAKLNILCALSHGSQLLILDEPTSGLDVIARDEILELLNEYMEEDTNRSILISSHISSDLENLCDDIYMIDEGKIILHEDTDILLDNYAIMKIEEEKLKDINNKYLLKKKKEFYGYSLLTNNKSYYLDEYSDIIIEKNSIDKLIEIIIKGENI